MMSNDIDVSRRDFIKGSTAALAALSVGMGVATQERESEEGKSRRRGGEPVACGFIGVGSQGTVLLRYALQAPDVRIVAICDIHEPNLQRALSTVKGARGYSDYRRMLEREKDLQAVIIATPLHWHAPIAIAAMQAGKHVFCEKAMARTIEDCKRMARTSRDTGMILQIGHQRRYNPMYHHAFNLIAKEKVLGRITHIRACWHRNTSWRRPLPKKVNLRILKQWGYPDADHFVNWRLYKRYSAGLLTELASHQIDAINWFLNATPIAVSGIGGIDYWRDGREVHDNVELIYEYPNGIKVVYTSITTNAFDSYYEQFMGDEGTIILEREYSARMYRERRAKELPWEEFAKKLKTSKGEAIVLNPYATKRQRRGKELQRAMRSAYYLELAAFFDCVREGRQPLANAYEAMKGTIAVLVALDAVESQRRIEFTEDVWKI